MSTFITFIWCVCACVKIRGQLDGVCTSSTLWVPEIQETSQGVPAQWHVPADPMSVLKSHSAFCTSLRSAPPLQKQGQPLSKESADSPGCGQVKAGGVRNPFSVRTKAACAHGQRQTLLSCAAFVDGL